METRRLSFLCNRIVVDAPLRYDDLYNNSEVHPDILTSIDSLAHLHLQGNISLGSEGATYLAPALEKLAGLVELNLVSQGGSVG